MKKKQTSELEPGLVRRLSRLATTARLVVFWERLWPACWPLLIVSSLFLTVVFFDLLPLLGANLHSIVLILLGLGSLILIAQITRSLKFPSLKDGLDRLDRDSGFTHHPLHALLDRPMGQERNKIAQAIWISHQDRMAGAMAQVKLNGPTSYLYKRDPYSLRAGLIILLLLGGLEARFDMKDRFVRALYPSEHEEMLKDWVVQAWITPPAYTGLGTTYLSSSTSPPSPPIVIAQHSDILLRLEGRPTRDKITLTTGPFNDRFENLGKGVFNLETRIDQGNRLAIKRNGKTIFEWPIEIRIDEPPAITLGNKPRSGFRGHLSLSFKAEDDYGLKEAALIIQKPGQEGEEAEKIILTQSVVGQDASGSFRENLSYHPWAGQKVVATPRITDNNNQSAYGQGKILTLPERHFSHPLSRQLVDMRKKLYGEDPATPVIIRAQLGVILQNPVHFDHQIPVFLALNAARHRLFAQNTNTESNIKTIQSLLWESAVHLEEGSSGTARDRLEDMSRQMQDLMQNPEDRAAMEALFEQMKQSLDQYLQKMAQNQNPFEGMEDLLKDENMRMIGRDEMLNMLNQAREMMRTGDLQNAMKMMANFQNMLSQLAMQENPSPEMAEKVNKLMKALRAIVNGEQNLLDRTFKRTRNQDTPSLESTRDAIREAEEQRRLRQELDQFFAALKKMALRPPKALQKAAQEMDVTVKHLEKGLDENAIQSETRAVQNLMEGLKSSAQALAQKMGMQPQPGQLPGYDPLGRGRGGQMTTEESDVVPTEMEMHRARSIMKELYRRAGEKGRPEQELKYIERLLDRF